MTVHQLTCIQCPIGCELTVTIEAEGATPKVTGNSCARGLAYGIAEFTKPTRTVTGTLRVAGGTHPVVSVKTVPPVPKATVLQVAQALRGAVVTAPVAAGDMLIANVCDTGSDVIATTNVHKREGAQPQLPL